MAWNFGDGFDLYTSNIELATGYWDSGVPSTLTFQAGRFSGQSIQWGSSLCIFTKASNVNDPVHHFTLGFRQTATLTGSGLSHYFTLYDGATAQCSIVFRQDGAILLTAGLPNGATLATFTGGVTAANTWFGFEFEVVIHNTAGSFTVRRNGNTSNDFSATALNTRASANNYANKMSMGLQSAISSILIDDVYWQSGAATGVWLGDIRAFTRMPATDASVQFSKAPASYLVQTTSLTASTGAAQPANSIRATPVTAPATGILTGLVFNLSSALTGHINMALYDATGLSGGPGSLIAQSTQLTNPGVSLTTFPITGSPVVTKGVTYWAAVWADAAFLGFSGVGGSGFDSLAVTYAGTFPATMLGFTVVGPTLGIGSNGMIVVPNNASLVNEAQQDGVASYVYDSNVNDQDFYNIASIPITPAYVVACTTRGYVEKSDAGVRGATVQLKSGATIAAAPTLNLSSTFLWVWRTDVTDPNTGAAWTPASVNGVQIGPKVVS